MRFEAAWWGVESRNASMTKRVRLLVVTLFMCPLSFVQTNCPEGLKYAGTLSGTGSVIEAFSKRVGVKLPKDATLDTAYQQTSFRADNGQGHAHSNLRPQDISKGIYIIPYGSNDLDKGWSVVYEQFPRCACSN